jgi:Uri superfamily endonuclease
LNSFYEIIQMKSPACFARIDRHRDTIEAMMWHLPAHTELDFDQVIGNSIPEEQKRKINSFEASAVPEGEVTPIMCR